MRGNEKLLYVVYLGDTPIGVHKWPWMALNEAKERSVDGKPASVVAYKHAYPVGVWGETHHAGSGVPADEFSAEGPTDPDCVPCSHEMPCDDAWKTNKSGAV